MRTLRICLFPAYVQIRGAFGGLFDVTFEQLLNSREIKLERVEWDGNPASLPVEPCMVRASKELKYSWQLLAAKCTAAGHFLFYNDQIVKADGETCTEGFLAAFEQFLTGLKE